MMKIMSGIIVSSILLIGTARAEEPKDTFQVSTQWYHQYPLQQGVKKLRATRIEQTHERAARYVRRGVERATDTVAQIVAHPVGCPATRFCGCGTSVRAYGHPVRDLYLATNWSRFPRTVAAAGMVAYRRGHVFYIERVLSNGTVLAYDPNSGGHKTRIHARSLAGYTVVDPRGRA